jgi:predicted nuclease of predicted toxin-antitoxin system
VYRVCGRPRAKIGYRTSRMKLLFDENLSPRLVQLLQDLFSDSVHVRDVGLKASDDLTVWKYAQDNSLIICSKDSDMHQRSFLMGFPPKVVWVRLGNCSTSDVEKLLRKHFSTLEAFAADDYASFLSLS